MDNPAEQALAFVRKFAALAERLAKHDIVMCRLHCDWSGFGSWTVEASSGDAERKRSLAILRHAFGKPGPEVSRVTWDGKDRLLSMASTPTEVSVMLNQWQHLDGRSDISAEVAFTLTEEWLRDRLGSSQTP